MTMAGELLKYTSRVRASGSISINTDPSVGVEDLTFSAGICVRSGN